MNDKHAYIKLALKWKKTLLLIFGISVIGSVIFSGPFFIKPLFKSSATLFPINILPYSEESKTEQMLQLLTSEELHLKIIDSLNLYKHYGINKDEIFAVEKILEKFNKRVNIKRTQFESVKIDVSDKEPLQSFRIINGIIYFYNQFSLELFHKKAREILAIKEYDYLLKKKEVDSLYENISSLIKESGLQEYNILKEMVRGGFNVFLTPSGSIKNQLFAEKSFDIYFYQNILENEILSLNELKNEYENALLDTKKNLVFADIISAPRIPNKKSYPIRWFIVLISVSATMFLAYSIILFTERFKNK